MEPQRTDPPIVKAAGGHRLLLWAVAILGALLLGAVSVTIYLAVRLSEETVSQDSEPCSKTEAIEEDGAWTERVSVVTHARADTGSTFWALWQLGAEDAALNMGASLTWNASGYAVETHALMIKEACSGSDGLVVTVPFTKGTPAYEAIDDEINECLERGETTVVIANTDSYENAKAWGYIGSANAQIGSQCARMVLTGNHHEASAGRIHDWHGLILHPVPRVIMYLSDDELANEGIARRAAAFNSTWYEATSNAVLMVTSLQELSSLANVTTLPEDRSEAEDFLGNVTTFPENVTTFTENVTTPTKTLVVALGIGAFKRAVPYSDFNCGDDTDTMISFAGQNVYSQAAMAVYWALSASRGKYQGVHGNSANTVASAASQTSPSSVYQKYMYKLGKPGTTECPTDMTVLQDETECRDLKSIQSDGFVKYAGPSQPYEGTGHSYTGTWYLGPEKGCLVNNCHPRGSSGEVICTGNLWFDTAVDQNKDVYFPPNAPVCKGLKPVPEGQKVIDNVNDLVQAVSDPSIKHIILESGTYRLTDELKIDISDRPIKIEAATIGEVFLTGGSNKRVIYIQAGTYSELIGLSITGGRSTEGAGGVYVNGAGVTFTNCNIYENTATGQGGGVRIDGGDVTFTDCNIYENTAHYDEAGGVYIYNAEVAFINCNIYENSANYGGGVYIYNGEVTFTYCNIYSNTADGTRSTYSYDGDVRGGGGVYTQSSILTFTGCNIYQNFAYQGGGVYVYYGTATLTDCNIYENTATYGGGLFSSGGTIKCTNCNIYENSAETGSNVYPTFALN